MNLVKIDATKTMTSREIAELTGKELSNVHRDIRAMLDELKKDDSNMNHPQEDKDARGYTTCFHLNRILTETLLTGYSAVARMKVIKRWHELENRSAQQAPALPLSPVELKLGEQLGIARMFAVPLHLAQVEAVKNINADMGVDLHQWLRLAPAQDNIKADDVFLEPTEIGRLFGVDGKFINAGLLNVGLQSKVGNVYKPSNEAQAHAQAHQWAKGNKSGMNLKWRLSFVKKQLNLKEAA